ncbi:MAG: alpha/beta hydrolase [Nannocystaceae bacterium]|nr:alpha/beta hydrolase [Nannocystaceae bacterium]
MLACREFGVGGRVVVFLHGFFGSSADLEPLAGRILHGSGRALLPDLLGHGDSPELPERAELSTMADALIAWLDAQGMRDRVPVVAHSMGGRVALRAIDRFPGRIGPLLLLDAPPGPVLARRSPLSPFMNAMCAAPKRAASEAELMAVFEQVMMGDALRRWIRRRIKRDAGGVTWDFDRERLADYRNASIGEDLWPVVATLDPSELAVFAPCVSPYFRAADRERYSGLGIEVHTHPEATHDMHRAMPEPFVQSIQGLLGTGFR